MAVWLVSMSQRFVKLVLPREEERLAPDEGNLSPFPMLRNQLRSTSLFRGGNDARARSRRLCRRARACGPSLSGADRGPRLGPGEGPRVERRARLLQAPSVAEPARVDGDEADLLDEPRDDLLRLRVVAREQDRGALVERELRASPAREVLREQRVECLDEAGPGERPEHLLARGRVAEVVRGQVGAVRVRRVDQDRKSVV